MENIDPILSDDEVQRLAEMIIELHPDKLDHQSVIEIALALFEDIAGLELINDKVSAELADKVWRVIVSI